MREIENKISGTFSPSFLQDFWDKEKLRFVLQTQGSFRPCKGVKDKLYPGVPFERLIKISKDLENVLTQTF